LPARRRPFGFKRIFGIGLSVLPPNRQALQRRRRLVEHSLGELGAHVRLIALHEVVNEFFEVLHFLAHVKQHLVQDLTLIQIGSRIGRFPHGQPAPVGFGQIAQQGIRINSAFDL